MALKAELQRDPSRSDRVIAKAVGVNDKTASKARRELQSTAEIPRFTATTGADGKVRTRKVTVRHPKTGKTFERIVALAPGKKLSEDRIAEVRALAAEGMNAAQVAARTGDCARYPTPIRSRIAASTSSRTVASSDGSRKAGCVSTPLVLPRRSPSTRTVANHAEPPTVGSTRTSYVNSVRSAARKYDPLKRLDRMLACMGRMVLLGARLIQARGILADERRISA